MCVCLLRGSVRETRELHDASVPDRIGEDGRVSIRFLGGSVESFSTVGSRQLGGVQVPAMGICRLLAATSPRRIVRTGRRTRSDRSHATSDRSPLASQGQRAPWDGWSRPPEILRRRSSTVLVDGHPPNPLSETLPNDSQMTPKAADVQIDESPGANTTSHSQPTRRHPRKRLAKPSQTSLTRPDAVLADRLQWTRSGLSVDVARRLVTVCEGK